MTPEDYLMQVKDIDLRIRSLEGELHDSEVIEDLEYAQELRQRIEKDKKRYELIKLRIRDEIQQIGDNKLSALLTEYYVRGRSWEQVTEALGVRSVKNTRENLRAAALKKFAEKYPQYFIR